MRVEGGTKADVDSTQVNLLSVCIEPQKKRKTMCPLSTALVSSRH